MSTKPIPAEPPLKPAKWLVVVPTQNGKGTSGSLWNRLEAMTQQRRDVRVAVVDSHEPDGDMTAYAAVVGRTGFRYLSLPCSEVIGDRFNWPRAVNTGLGVFASPLVLLLHDDVDIPDDPAGEWLDRLEAALGAPGVGLAVPTLTGDCGNPVQSLELPSDLPFVETAEFVSSACLAIRRETLALAGGFDEAMGGYEWQQVLLQYALAAQSLSTVVVPASSPVRTLHHSGGGTYNRSAVDALYAANVAAYCAFTGIQLEYKMRPSKPRIAPKLDVFPHGPTDKTRCFVVDSDSGVRDALKLALADRNCLSAVIVDANPSLSRFDMVTAAGHQRIGYFAAWDTDLVRQAISSAPSEYVIACDLRSGHALPPATATGKRLRIGAHYDLPQRLKVLDIGMWRDVGMGDSLMLTPALRAFKAKYSHVKIKVHHCWEAGRVLDGLPFVDEVTIAENGDQPPLEMFNAGEGAGSEGTIRQMFINLGVSPSENLNDPAWEGVDRSLAYSLLPGEQEDAAAAIEGGFGAVLPEKPVIVGVQVHGGWKSKNWAYTAAFVPRLLEEGYFVVLFGTEAARTPIVADDPRIYRLEGKTIRQAIAVISLLDVLVTFDSGLGYAAAAVGCPCVSLWGPHSPSGLIMDTGAPNIAAIRNMTPKMCHDKHGFSCRSGGRQTGGSSCPLRGEGEVGADCLDSISTCNVLDEVLVLPKWKRPIRERF